jgi:pimeloyl-ACP methyl ester carboxylesterase
MVVRLPSGSALVTSAEREAAGAPVLFLHGVGGGAWSWQPQAAACAPERPTYVWEARGHGNAARVADAGLGDYYMDAQEALAAVEAAHGAPAWLVGHSMGGLLALALAAERPSAVRGLVLIDPVYAPAGGAHGGKAFAALMRRAVVPLVNSIAADGVVARAVSRWIFEASFLDRACMLRAWRSQRTQVPVEYPKMMYEAFDGPTGFPNRAFAREIVQPTLLVEPLGSGGQRLVELAADLAPLRERFTAVALDGGHYLQLDRSGPRLTRELVSFLARW